MQYDYDLFVIGAGSGGVRAARMAAAKGIRVAVADNKALGGTCVNVGCVPKKLYSYASHFGHCFSEAKGFGWHSESRFDWSTLVDNKKTEISRLNGIYQNLLENTQVQIIRGFATLEDAHTVVVNDQTYRCEKILIATGGKPFVPDTPWARHVITSDQVFDLAEFPERLLVVGAGYIALEFACIFKGLGAQVEVTYRGDSVLRGFDTDVRQFMDKELAKQGIQIYYQSNIQAIEKTAAGLQVTLDNGITKIVDQVLMAAGRMTNLTNIGLEKLTIEQSKNGKIKVNQHFATNIPNIYALGDITEGPSLTPVALAEAMTLVDHLYGTKTKQMDYNNIATAVFTHPNIGTVGLSEAEARAQYNAVDIYRSDFKALKHTLSGSDERSLMKMIVDKTSDKVIGIHIVGEGAGEIMQGFAIAVKAGLTKAQFDQTIGIHPTAAEELVTMREPIKG